MLPALIEASQGSGRKYLSKEEAQTFRRHFSEDVKNMREYSKGKVLFNEFLPENRPFTFEFSKYKNTCQQFIEIHRTTVERMHSEKLLKRKELLLIARAFKRTHPSYSKHLLSLAQ